MLVSGGKIRKKIEDKFDFKFKNNRYFTKNRYFYDKIFSTIICENKENIYMIEMHDDKIEIIYVGNEELKLADEEMVILKLGNYFIDEKKLFGNWR